MQSINPATGDVLQNYAAHTQEEAFRRIGVAHACFAGWKSLPFTERGVLFHNAACILRERKSMLAALMADAGRTFRSGCCCARRRN